MKGVKQMGVMFKALGFLFPFLNELMKSDKYAIKKYKKTRIAMVILVLSSLTFNFYLARSSITLSKVAIVSQHEIASLRLEVERLKIELEIVNERFDLALSTSVTGDKVDPAQSAAHLKLIAKLHKDQQRLEKIKERQAQEIVEADISQVHSRFERPYEYYKGPPK